MRKKIFVTGIARLYKTENGCGENTLNEPGDYFEDRISRVRCCEKLKNSNSI
jgi:hypothetical protein